MVGLEISLDETRRVALDLLSWFDIFLFVLLRLWRFHDGVSLAHIYLIPFIYSIHAIPITSLDFINIIEEFAC